MHFSDFEITKWKWLNMNMDFKRPSAKCRKFCLGLNLWTHFSLVPYIHVYIWRWTESPLVEIMACHLIEAVCLIPITCHNMLDNYFNRIAGYGNRASDICWRVVVIYAMIWTCHDILYRLLISHVTDLYRFFKIYLLHVVLQFVCEELLQYGFELLNVLLCGLMWGTTTNVVTWTSIEPE